MDRQNTPRSFKVVFSLLCWEGAFATAYETWVGPIYLSGLAGEMKIKLSLLVMLTSLPWIGAMGQVLGFFVFERFHSVKKYTLFVASLARSLWTVPALLGLFWGWQSFTKNVPFPVENW